jgi:hypothetical protein
MIASCSTARATYPAVLLACLVACGKPKHVTVVLERGDIEERLKAKFPVEKERLLSRVLLDDPRLILQDGSDRIGIDVRVKTKVPLLREYTGRMAATGKLAYRFEDKAFYLTEPTIERIEIAGLEAEHVERVRPPIEAVARSVLERFPVYEFKRRTLKEVTAEYVLRAVTVQDGRVHAELALPF